MRDREYSISKPKGIYRIIFFGDSITCYGKYTDLLEERLNEAFPGRFEVWNCAIGGQGIKEYESYLRRRCLKYAPDMVIIGLNIGDDFRPAPVIFKTASGQINCYRPFRASNFVVDNWLYCHSYLYRFLMTRIEERIGYRGKDDFVTQESFGEKYLRRIRDTASARGIKLLIVIFPRLAPDSEETVNYKAVTTALNNLKLDRIDLHEYFLKKERTGLRQRPEDNCHPSEKGDIIAAGAIFDYLDKELGSR
jgi:hypothetical protein